MPLTFEAAIDGLKDGKFNKVMKSDISSALESKSSSEDLLDLDDMVYDERYDDLKEELEDRGLLDEEFEAYASSYVTELTE